MGMSSGIHLTTLPLLSLGAASFGALTVPAGLTGSRASIRNVMTSDVTMLAGGVASGQLAVGQPTASSLTRGVSMLRPTSNVGPTRTWTGTNPVTGTNWTQPQAFGTEGTLTNAATTGIDGTVAAASVVALGSGKLGIYAYPWQGPSYPAVETQSISYWVKQRGSQTMFQHWGDGGAIPSPSGSVAILTTLTSAWAKFSVTQTRYGNGWQHFCFPDARDHAAVGGTGVYTYDAFVDCPQIEIQPYPTTWQPAGTARLGDCLQVNAASTLAPDGRIRLEIALCSEYGSAQLYMRGDAHLSRVLWKLDAQNYVEIDCKRQKLVCVIGGVVAVFPVALVYSALDRLVFRVDCGAGLPMASYSINGAASVSLGTASGGVQPYIRTEDAALDLFCDSTSGTAISQIDAYVRSCDAFLGAARAPTGATYYASPSGSGSGTKASPASLAGALALATSGDTILLRGGTYRQTSTLALTAAQNGVTIANYPREVPIISGHALLAGTWAVDSGAVYKLTGVSPIALGNQVFVNGVRANLASLTIASPGTWAVTGTGFTAPDTAVSLLARPTDVVVEWKQAWRHGYVPLTAVSGTTLTASTTALANAQSAVGVAYPGTSYPLLAAQLTKLRNAREYVTAAGDYYYNAATSTLYYYPRSTDNMATAVVEVGAVDCVLSVGGSLAAKATGITLRGIIFEGSTWSGATAPSAVGYSSAQAGITGFVGDYFGVHGTYYRQPAALDLSLSTGTVVAGCIVRRTAAAGIAMPYGTQDAAISGTTVTDTGGVGIYDGDVTATAASESDVRARVTGNTVISCTLTLIGRTYYDSVAWLRGYTSGSTFTRNRVDQVSWSGIQNGWGWGAQNPSPLSLAGACTITWNYITRSSDLFGPSSDSAALYSNGRQGTACTIQYNYVETGNDIGIYVDNATCLTLVDSNVVGPDGATAPTAAYGGYWAALNIGTIPAVNNTITGNYAPLNNTYNIAGGGSGTNTVTGNIAGPTGYVGAMPAAAAAIRSEAGR